jgi:hypothetical protein
MTDTITIRGDRGEINIRLLGREIPTDENWVRAGIATRIDSFSGEISAWFFLPELSEFRLALESSLTDLNKEVQFASMEGNWKLKVRFTTTGTAWVSGSITPDPSRANTLLYELESDPISLEQTARDLQRAVQDMTKL